MRDMEEGKMATFKDVYDDFKAGRCVRRGVGWESGMHLDPGLSVYSVHSDDLLADDWHVIEKKITITNSEFNKAARVVFEKYKGQSLNDLVSPIWDLKKELGL